MTTPTATPADVGTFRHEALIYSGDDEFVSRVATFIGDAVAAGEPTLVVVGEHKISALRAAGCDHDLVRFADMADVGANPARIIPYWRDFAGEHQGTAIRGVGEPISRERGSAELAECHQHEALLNLAFADTRDFYLLCPYDGASLDADVIQSARRSHPYVLTDDVHTDSETYAGLDAISVILDAPLPEPLSPPAEYQLRPGPLAEFRAFVADRARAAGLDPERTSDLVVAANEIVSNSVLYGGGSARVRVWREDAVICEVRDAGRITNALIGRQVPGVGEHDSRGLWMVNQLCDLVQVRSSTEGTVVRLHMRAI